MSSRWSRVIAVAFSLQLGGSAVSAASPDVAETAISVDRALTDDIGRTSAVPRADDQTFVRRVFLDLIGQPPTAEDVLAFSFDSAENKREQLVENLLNDRAFGDNWARYWRDVIMYRRTEPRAALAANPLQTYLAEQLNANTKWDAIATEFITAAGDVRENGATALIMAQGGRPEDVVAEVSRIFMGIQIQCAQCHDHPTDRWERRQFHELAAFFPRVAVRPRRDGEQRSFEVVANDRTRRRRKPNNNNRVVGTPEHHMPDLDDPGSQGTKMQPVFFVTGRQLPPGAVDAERRGTLADWITAEDNPWFAKAFVNRIWAELVGEGLSEPVDDLGPDRDCTAPETLDLLAGRFTESGHDIKWLYRTIMATEAYQRASRTRREFDGVPFQANCSQRLRGDQLYDVLLAALGITERNPRARQGGGYGRPNGPRTAFNQSFGFDPSEPREEIKSSVQQALAVMNSRFTSQAINARRNTRLAQILRTHDDDQTALTELYLQTLSRAPTDTELRTCMNYVRKLNNRNEAFEDVQWALINSTELLYRP